MNLDDFDQGADYGSAFGLLPTIDFNNISNGTVWFSVNLPEGWYKRNIKFTINYNLNGSDGTKNILIENMFWCLEHLDAPNVGNYTSFTSENIVTVSGDEGKFTNLDFMHELSKSLFNSSTSRILFKITRNVTVLNNYGGTFQLISIKLTQ
jgi:hypothetical protein